MKANRKTKSPAEAMMRKKAAKEEFRAEKQIGTRRHEKSIGRLRQDGCTSGTEKIGAAEKKGRWRNGMEVCTRFASYGLAYAC